MGLLTDKVNVTLGGSNIKYYENLGYTIPYVTKNSKTSVPWGTTIMVDIKDLSKGANVTVPVKCDCCGKTEELMYAKYLKNIERNNGQYICKNTAAHTEINSNANLEKLRKQLIDYLSVNNDFPYFEDFTEDNGFTFSYSQARAICKLNNTTLNDLISDINCFKAHVPNARYYYKYVDRLKEYIEIDSTIVHNLDLFVTCKASDLPKFKWFIDNCPDKSVCDTDTFKQWIGLYTNVLDKETCTTQILNMQKHLARPLMYDDFKGKENGRPTVSEIKKYWGSLNKMKKALGLEIVQESMLERHLNKDELMLHIKQLADSIKVQGRNFTTTREINENPDFLNYISMTKLTKQYYNKSFAEILASFGVHLGKEGRGILFDFEDGEHTTSQFEYMFSKFLKDYGLVYNKDYFRDVKYSTFIDGYKKQMNCDYVIHYKGKTIYIEIAGIINEYKSYYYRNQVIDKSKSKEKYRLKLKEKEEMLKKQGLIYFLLFPCDMTQENFKAILEDSSLELKHSIEKFIRNNIDWEKVRQKGELKYTDRIVRTNREIDYGEAI